MIPVNVKFNKKDRDGLKEIALKDRTNVSAVVRIAVVQYLKRRKIRYL